MTPNSESVEQLAERIVRHDVGGWYAGSDRARVTASIRDWLVSHNIDPATMQPMDSETVKPDAHRGAVGDALAELRAEAARLEREGDEDWSFGYVVTSNSDATCAISVEADELLSAIALKMDGVMEMQWTDAHDAIARANGLKTLAEMEATPFPGKFADDVSKLSQPAKDVERDIAEEILTYAPSGASSQGFRWAEATAIVTNKLKPLRDDYERVKAELERVRSNQRIDIACLKECKKQLAEAREALAEIQDEHQHLAELQQQLVESRERVNLLEKIQANTLSHTRDIVERLKGQMMVLANPQPANAEGASR